MSGRITISVEKNVLSALLQSREAYNLLAPVLSENDFSVHGQIIYKCLAEYYNKDVDAESINKSIILSSVGRTHPKHRDMFTEIIEELSTCSVINVVDEFIELKKNKCAHELSSALLQQDSSLIKNKLQEYQELLDTSFLSKEDEAVIYQPDLVELFKNTEHNDTIPVIPAQLNTMLKGRLRRGHHVIIFARPEVGKSLFSINFSFGFCKRGYIVLYLCNEEPVEDVLDRFLSRFTGIDIDEVRKDPKKTQDLAVPNGFNNLILVKSHAGTTMEIERLIKEHKPDVVVVDQIKNLDISGATDEMSTVIKASRFMRRIGKQYNVVSVSVTQAGDSATNKVFLHYNDIYSSKTAVSGDADLMIGIGANEEMIQQGRRMINLPKNKVSGKHSSFPTEIDTRHSKVLSI